jgi:conjugal transfer pilus assembly protein TraK
MQSRTNFLIKIIILATITIFLKTNLALSSQIKIAEDGADISAEISKYDINRINLISDRVKSVKSNANELEVSYETKSGDIYVRPLMPEKPVNLFIITEQNFTYKLLLLPKSVPSEQIFIKNDSVITTSDKDLAKITKSPYEQQIITLIKAMRERKKLENYQIKTDKKYIDLGDIEMRRNTIYKGQNWLGEIFTLKNSTNRLLNLKEQIFFKGGVRAIKIENPELLEGQETEIYIIS